MASESEIHALNTLIRSLLPQQSQRHRLDTNNNTKAPKSLLVLPSMPYERDLATSLTDLNNPPTPPPTPMVLLNDKSVKNFLIFDFIFLQ
jgi:hypothetical protein